MIRQKRQEVDEAVDQIRIAALEKQIKDLDDQIEELNKQIEAINEHFEELIAATEKSFDAQVEALQKKKEKWQELMELPEKTKMIQLIESYGFTEEQLMNDEAAFEQFKNMFVNGVNEINSNPLDLDKTITGDAAATQSLNDTSNEVDNFKTHVDSVDTTSSGESVVGKFISGVKSKTSEIQTTGKEVVESFKTGIEQNVTAVDPAVQTLVDHTKEQIDSVQGGPPATYYDEEGVAVDESIANGMTSDAGFGKLDEAVGKVTDHIKEKLESSESTDKIKEVGETLDTAIGDGLVENVSVMTPQVEQMVQDGLITPASDKIQSSESIQAVNDALRTLIQSMLETGNEEMTKLAQEIVQTFLDTFKSSLEEAFSEIESLMTEKGTSISQGLAQGIRDSMGEVQSAMSEMINTSVIDNASTLLDSHSPSQVFVQKGDDIDQGLANGISENSSKVTTALTNLINQMFQSGDPQMKTTATNLVNDFNTSFNTAFQTASGIQGLNTMLDEIKTKFQQIGTQAQTSIGTTATNSLKKLKEEGVVPSTNALTEDDPNLKQSVLDVGTQTEESIGDSAESEGTANGRMGTFKRLTSEATTEVDNLKNKIEELRDIEPIEIEVSIKTTTTGGGDLGNGAEGGAQSGTTAATPGGTAHASGTAMANGTASSEGNSKVAEAVNGIKEKIKNALPEEGIKKKLTYLHGTANVKGNWGAKESYDALVGK